MKRFKDYVAEQLAEAKGASLTQSQKAIRFAANAHRKQTRTDGRYQKNDKRRIYCTTLISFFIVVAAILAIWLDYSLEGVFIILASLFPTFLKELLKFFAKAP